MTRRDELLKLAGEFLVVYFSARREMKIAAHNDSDFAFTAAQRVGVRAWKAATECAELADKLGAGK